MQRASIVLRLLALVTCLGLTAGVAVLWPLNAAFAQDDDDGDDDDDDEEEEEYDDDRANDDDDDDRDPTGTTRDASRRPRAAVIPEVALPTFAPDELVSLALTQADLATLVRLGYRVLEERPVPEIGIVSRRLAIPDGIPLDTARDQVRALASGSDADFNHYYRTEQASETTVCLGPHCPSYEQIGWLTPLRFTRACAGDVVVGVIDTGINPDHQAFSQSRLDVYRLTPESLEPSRAVHGTAVVSLLIGDPDSRSPGLVPAALVVAVDAFHSAGGDERADVFTLAAGMNFLAGRDIRLINMSLAGPPNSVLERATAALVARDIVIVAAVGNGGPAADPAYPAAYPGVIAVTAVDGQGEVYRRAGRGAHVDFAAPGVDVWAAASVSGARPKTGTSFAAPFVTATAAAILAQAPDLSGSDLTLRLATAAQDIGENGRDDVFGHGMVQATQGCVR